MSDSSQPRSRSGRKIRAEAARCVADVVSGDTSLAAYYARWARTEDDTRGLLRALVTECLRWHHRLQWQLEQLLDRPLPAKEAQLAALIRLGLLQLQFMRIPDHAAVDETVAATREIRRQHSRGLVNAVLRRFQREQALLEQRMAENDVARLSHPQWLVSALRGDWPEQAEGIFAANNAAAPLWLRVNQQRMAPDAYAQRLLDKQIDFVRDPELTAALRPVTAMPVAQLPGYLSGEVSAQDRNAQLAAQYLDLRPGQRVLDACAAPGGKTAAIVESCAGLAEVVALDQSQRRLETLNANLQRLGLSATVLCADATAVDQWWDGRHFERVLLDAPCSATGVIRRHPDIKLRRSSADVEAAVGTQQALLAALWPLLAKDGRLLYVTCSMLRCENDAQIDRFLTARPDAQLEAAHQYLPGEADGDGFYYACVKKTV